MGIMAGAFATVVVTDSRLVEHITRFRSPRARQIYAALRGVARGFRRLRTSDPVEPLPSQAARHQQS